MTARKPLTAWQAEHTPDVLPLHIRRNIAPGDDGCWLWQRSLSPDGYGWASLDRRTHQAHRLVYTLTIGPVPEGLVLDHLCRVRHCVNPDHLEPVTGTENLRRGNNANASKTHCKFGHLFDELNTSHQQGANGIQRGCRTCHAQRERERRRAA